MESSIKQKEDRLVDISVLVCTFNRCADLREMLATLLVQETDGEFTYEVIVVDNNSTDLTRQVVNEFIARGHSNLRYVFEPRQGKSYALNKGLELARGTIFTIGDDDFILPPDWLKKIYKTFQAHPEVAVVSGKVLPLWQAEVPKWLTQKHWSAIAMADYGDKAFYADKTNEICLLACSFRRADVIAAGGYRAELGVSSAHIGGIEDLDILTRLWDRGHKALYEPSISFQHKVGANRLTRQYHRRWHLGHGYFYAVMRDERLEESAARFLGVPAYLYRQALLDLLQWTKCIVTFRWNEAFLSTTQLCFFAGFFQKRRRDHRQSGAQNVFKELLSFASAVAFTRQ